MRCSWPGSRYEKSRQTATDSTPSDRDLARDPVRLGIVERLDHARGAGLLARADPVLGGGKRPRLGCAEPIERGPVLAADLEQVLEALRGHQRRAGPRSLAERVGANGHPVDEASHAPGRAPAASRTAPIAVMTPADSSPGWSAPSPGRSSLPSNATASVKVPPTSTPSSTSEGYDVRRPGSPAGPLRRSRPAPVPKRRRPRRYP